jgi:outer membrane protein TolC
MKRLLTLFACIFSFHGAAAADLVAVYQRALQNDPQLREAEANRLAALESKPQALAALLPQVTGTALAAKERDVGPSNQAFSFTDVSTGKPVVVVENQDFNGVATAQTH